MVMQIKCLDWGQACSQYPINASSLPAGIFLDPKPQLCCVLLSARRGLSSTLSSSQVPMSSFGNQEPQRVTAGDFQAPELVNGSDSLGHGVPLEPRCDLKDSLT